MRHLSYLLVLCLAALCYNIEARKAAVENDLYFNDNKPMTTVAPSDGSGMGDDEDDDDEGSASLSDDEDDDDDNEGSGYESEPPMETCLEKLLKVQDAGLNEPYKPSCDEDGYYTKLQCHDMLGQCWCATKDGSEIDGTRKSKGIPKCDPVTHSFNVIARYELDFRATVKAEGKFKQMVKKKLMYSYEKTFDGNSVNIRINSIAPGSVIVDYDVDVTGIAMKEPTTSEVEQAVRDANVAPLLDIRAIKKEDITMPPTPMRETTTRRKPMKKTTPAGYDIVTEKPMKTKVPMVATTEQSNVLNPKGPKVEKEEVDEKELEEKEEESNEVGLQENGNYQASTGLMAQPGLLAGVIGGAVVGLLFAVLLVMFIVYRMRKKDEGSYALDEPKSPRLNTYTKAPNKEFYA